MLVSGPFLNAETPRQPVAPRVAILNRRAGKRELLNAEMLAATLRNSTTLKDLHADIPIVFFEQRLISSNR
jgi:hypothetical protein